MCDNQELAELLYPQVSLGPQDILAIYPQRKLGDMVTRFAPSPTGMLHLGGLYAALYSERLAHQSGGVFYLRIEDTDKKREVQESVPDILDSLAYFGIQPDEGVGKVNTESGAYGPYRQSYRTHIYQVFIKTLIAAGYAYPCFCDEAELESMRKLQENSGIKPGYYGSWAKHRHFTLEQVRKELSQGTPYVIRLKAAQTKTARVIFRDLIKGRIEMADNDQDVVLVKSDGLPTYHLAHVVDDYLMGTTHVIRGDEWLPSVPLHLQLFKYLGWPAPTYGHIAPLLKREGNSIRKFSKRKDLDAIARFYRREGYPGEAVVEYFLNLMNSNFEAWRREHPGTPVGAFEIQMDKTSTSGALFDPQKFYDVSRRVIATYAPQEIYRLASTWAEQYDPEFCALMHKYPDYTMSILSIERTPAKPKKAWGKWSELKTNLGYFYDELFSGNTASTYVFPKSITNDAAVEILKLYLRIYDSSQNHEVWFETIRNTAESLGYARNNRDYLKNPNIFRGNVGDVAMVIRVALCNQTATPDLYQMMQVMGEVRVRERLHKCLERLSTFLN